MDIVALAMDLTGIVGRFVERARRLYYAVVLMGHTCAECGGALVMVGESRCRCTSCGHIFDPTVAFQKCPECGGSPRLRIRRYQCRQCGADLASRFVFDGRVFDADYYRQAMAESRHRKQRRREQARVMAVGSRSAVLESPAVDLGSVPGLIEALDGLTAGLDVAALAPLCQGFDLKRYERHVRAHIGAFGVCFDDIPPIEQNPRKDRVWRFVALVFMAHAGLIEICQEGLTIMVNAIDDGKGQGVS